MSSSSAHQSAHSYRLRLATMSGLTALLVCAGCGDRSASTPAETSLRSHARHISQDDYDAWPFGPNQGVLRCRRAGSDRIVTFEAEGVTYALNRTARRRGFEDVRAILFTDHAGLPYDYSPVLRDGLTLCRG